MKTLSEPEIKNMISRLYWDAKVESDQLYGLLKGDVERVGHIDILNLYYRILTTFDWYTILRIFPQSKLGELLDDQVLEQIRFTDLKDKYLYARAKILQ
jgi:hypothetical protein